MDLFQTLLAEGLDLKDDREKHNEADNCYIQGNCDWCKGYSLEVQLSKFFLQLILTHKLSREEAEKEEKTLRFVLSLLSLC